MRRRPCAARRARASSPLVEGLEHRLLMAADSPGDGPEPPGWVTPFASGNLRMTNLLLVNASNTPIAAPAVGERVYVRAQWRTDGLTALDSYVVRFFVDGVPLDSATIVGAPGTNLAYSWYRGGWFASPGVHAVTATVDGADAVAETIETDNTGQFSFAPVAPTTLPAKFILPIAGRPFADWSFGNYADVDPREGVRSDYLGGPFQYDGHNAIDVGPALTTWMDEGVPIRAAAPGVVSRVVDGNFDRETSMNGNPANLVVIDHGNGWSTSYFHMARNSIVVRAGDAVVAGQRLGLMGSSGSSTNAHLHFNVTHDGADVETFYAPADYWVDPPAYQGDQPTRMMDFGVTNYDPLAHAPERASESSVFATSSTAPVWYWYRPTYLNAGDVMRIVWSRPDGTQATVFTPEPVPTLQRSPYYRWGLGRATWGTALGTWTVATLLNGVEMARAAFQVTSGAGVPEIRVDQGSTFITDGRTTPIAFGSAPLGSAGPQLAFTVSNHGSAPLAITGLALPPGFSLVGNAPTSIAAGANANFTVRLDTAVAGTRFGAIRLATNDADESSFTFNVEGTVAGAVPAGTPIIGLPGPAAAGLAGGIPVVLDGGATLADSDSPNFGGGRLVVEFAANGTGADRLAIRDQGTGAGRIGVVGDSVTFAGVVIGTYSGGVGLSPLVVALNAGASLAATRELIRSITYANASPTPATPPRYIRFTLEDGTGRVSNAAIKVAIQDYAAGITVDEVAGPLAVAEGGASAAYAVTLNIRPTGNVTITLATSGQLAATPRTLTFTPTNWRTPQTVVVSAVDDRTAEGAHFASIAHLATSADPAYDGPALGSVTVAIADNDAAGIAVSPPSGLVTTEAGGTASFTVVLTSRPTADVTIAVASSDPAEGVASVASLVFTAGNWDVPQVVTVTGVDDAEDDGDRAYRIVLGPVAGADPIYAAIDPSDVALINRDDDEAVDPPPAVASFVVEGGADQRSMVRSIEVRFGERVAGPGGRALDAAAFDLRDGSGRAIVPDVAVSEVGDATVAILTFSGAGIVGGSLGDGDYRLRVIAAQVVDSAGQHLDGDGDGRSDGSAVEDALLDFYRLLGDADGDRDVDAMDSFRFRQAYAGAPIVPGDLVAFDLDGDGDVDLDDYAAFRRNLGRSLAP